MAYERVNWENLPSTKTPVNADNLNKMDEGIANAEVYVGAEEPVAGEKVWFNKDKNSIYVRNSNGVYEEFAKKNEEVYSTEEVRIGTWIDGKPLYRKVFNFITDSETYIMRVFDTRIFNLDTIMIDMSHSFIKGTDNCKYFVNGIRPGSDTAITSAAHNWFRINDDKRSIAYVVGSLCASSPCYLTLEYTKTTD